MVRQSEIGSTERLRRIVWIVHDPRLTGPQRIDTALGSLFLYWQATQLGALKNLLLGVLDALFYSLNLAGVKTLGARLGFELHALAGLQCFITVHVDGRIVGENVTTPIVRQNKSVSLGVIEPLDDTCLHSKALPKTLPPEQTRGDPAHC